MRADAQRSYDRIVAVAGEVFVEQGTDASMNEIAKRAGVGPGTLYRHFPSREHLYDALLKDWVGQIQSAADQALAADLGPRELLITWFEAIIAHIGVHRGGAARLTAALGDSTSTLASKWQALVVANTTVLRHLEAQRAIRAGADSIQICRLVGGVGSVADSGDLSRTDTRKLLGLVADALLVHRGDRDNSTSIRRRERR
jgi:AcrR family transcriptional regulator